MYRVLGMNMLPPLPKKNKKKEADLGLLFRSWLFNNHNYKKFKPSEFELKDTRGKEYFSFAEYTQDQEYTALRSASDRGNLVRVEVGTTGAADYSYHRTTPTYLIIRYPKTILLIPVENFIFERDHSKKKSLSLERAKSIATIVIE